MVVAVPAAGRLEGPPAGDDIEAAVLYPEDERYLVGESTVTHYQVVDEVER